MKMLIAMLLLAPCMALAQSSTQQPISVSKDASEVKDNGDYYDCYLEVLADDTFRLGMFEDYKSAGGDKQQRMNSLTLKNSMKPHIDSVVKKFIEWRDLARKNKVAPFEKVIESYETVNFLGNKEEDEFRFTWDGMTATFYATEQSSFFTEREMDNFAKLLPGFSKMQDELKARVEKSKTDATLFK